MKKIIFITSCVVVCFLAALNASIVFDKEMGMDLSLGNIEALAWLEGDDGKWYPESGDNPSDNPQNKDPEYNSLDYKMETCTGKCLKWSYGMCIKYQEFQVQSYYCNRSNTETSCNQSDVDNHNAWPDDCKY